VLLEPLSLFGLLLKPVGRQEEGTMDLFGFSTGFISGILFTAFASIALFLYMTQKTEPDDQC
jgi:hypothetical protein